MLERNCKEVEGEYEVSKMRRSPKLGIEGCLGGEVESTGDDKIIVHAYVQVALQMAKDGHQELCFTRRKGGGAGGGVGSGVACCHLVLRVSGLGADVKGDCHLLWTGESDGRWLRSCCSCMLGTVVPCVCVWMCVASCVRWRWMW